MMQKHLDLFACPTCHGALAAASGCMISEGRILEGMLVCDQGHSFAISAGVPRFVPADNYAANFGYQWLKFRRTLLDSHSGHPIFKERFFSQSGWSAQQLAGKRVLEIGCGAGPFTEVVLEAGAEIVSIDYSAAVDACYANHGSSPLLTVAQANIYHLPFKAATFDFIFCFGVLQHTPDVKASFMALPCLLRPGGQLAVDVYRKHWSNLFHSKYWLRRFTTRIPNEELFHLVEKWVPRLMPLSNLVATLPGGRYLRRAVPVANYKNIFPLSPQQLTEWAILDTFDWLGPAYDQPQTAMTLKSWFEAAGLECIEVVHPAHLAVRGTKSC